MITIYRIFSLASALIFLVVGAVFLFLPAQVLEFFNQLSRPLGFTPAQVIGANFYLILTGGYMYLVTVIAFLMSRQPGNRLLPMLLAHGKTASSTLSLAFFILQAPYLIYLTNFIVDGIIGSTAWIFYLYLEKK